MNELSKMQMDLEENRERKSVYEMNALLAQLNSLVSHHHHHEYSSSKDEMVSVSGAVWYIKQVERRLNSMKQKKQELMLSKARIEVGLSGSAVDVVLITASDISHKMFLQAMKLLHEEGAEVVHATFSALDQTVFHTIHSKINGGMEYEAARERISERLNNLIITSPSPSTQL